MARRTLPSVVEMLRELVACPSVSAADPRFDQSNRAVIDRLATWAEDLGFRVERMAVPGAPGKENLLATLGAGEGGLVLSGHTDTVPYDRAGWPSNPFTLTEVDGRLVGLGAADMKCFFAVALEVARRIDPASLRAPLHLLATADEESTMSGARALVTDGRLRARHAVIGEPTGMRPVRMHKGVMMERIALRGHSGHSSNPSLGVSALDGMHEVLGALLAFRRELAEQHRDPAFEVPVPTLNLGRIEGGDSPNRICAQCELHIDLRPLPGMDLGALRAAIDARVRAAVEGRGLAVETGPLFEGVPAWSAAADAPVVRAAEALTGASAVAVLFGTEAPFLMALGMDTVVLGPGDIAVAHQPGEHVPRARLEGSVDIFEGLVRRFSVEGG